MSSQIKSIIMNRATGSLEITVDVDGADQRLVETFPTQEQLLARYDQLVAADIAKAAMPAYLHVDRISTEMFLVAFEEAEDAAELEYFR